MSSSSALVKRGKRGSYKKKYKQDYLLASLQSYVSPQPLTYQQAAAPYNIPESTLRDNHRRSLSAIASSPRYSIPADVMESVLTATQTRGTPRMLPEETEKKLKEWIDISGELTQPPSVTLIRLKAKRLYFALHNIAITEKNEDAIASMKWWRGFKNRFPTLRVGRTEPLKFDRAKATQPEIFNHFYDLLKYQLDKYRFETHQIYAADETGVAGDMKNGNAVGDRGRYTQTNKVDLLQHDWWCLNFLLIYFFPFWFVRKTYAEVGIPYPWSRVDDAYL